MNKILYVFDFEKLDDFKLQFFPRKFISIASILNLAPSIEEIDELDAEFMDNSMIDITALSLENGYYRLFIERYVLTLIDTFESVKFSIHSKAKDGFLKKFPYVFDEINEEFLEINEENINMEGVFIADKIDIEPLPLLLYRQSALEKLLEKYQIVSIGRFFTCTENINYKINDEVIKGIFVNRDIHYIDITQMVYSFELRKDLILAFEFMLRQIQNKKKDIEFLINEDMEKHLKKYFPFTFKYDKKFCDSNDDEEIYNSETDKPLEDVSGIIQTLTSNLMGHEDFKKDFSFNLKKFALLNKMEQRKIFSVFLTGESGIGKTEFAKILSELMYPNQKLIKINFGNYSNEGVLNSLIGSPLGYVGSEEGGELINKMKLSKSKVILIDEFEKATPSVFHFFYELLEDGKFTDRHGIEHNLNGYIIVFTSNMSKETYLKLIPDPLKSRFDMVYRFVGLSIEEKTRFIYESARTLIEKIHDNTLINVKIDKISYKLDMLIKYNNLRSIKRKIEDIVIEEYYNEVHQN